MLTKRIQPWRPATPRPRANCQACIDDIAGLADLDDVVQRFERLFDRRVVVPAMDLIEFDVVSAEAPEAGIDLVQDRLARQAGTIGSRPHPAIHLGGDDDLDTRKRGSDPSGGPAGLLGSPPMTGSRGRTPWALAAACSGSR